jgi:hypothetical protein
MVDRRVNGVLVNIKKRCRFSNIIFLPLGLQFGPDITEHFLKFNNLEYVVRSHEVKQEGYELAHNGKNEAFQYFIF